MKYNSFPLRNSRRVVVACLILAGVLSLGIILSGCSDNGFVINNDSSDDYVSFFDQPYYPDAVAKPTGITDASFKYVEKRLAAEQGGVIALNEDENLEAFVVLPVSFLNDTTFTVSVTRLVTEDGEMPIIYEFGPDGLVFSKAAVLRLNATELFGKNVSSVVSYWLNENTNLWEFDEVLEVDDSGAIYKSIPHFSAYGLAGAKGAGGVIEVVN